MKLLLASTMLFGTAIGLMAAANTSGVTYIEHGQVDASLAKSSQLVTRPDLLVQGSHRTGAGQVEMHDKETDVFYVTEGEATFITGGTMVGGKVTKPGQHMGTDIKGGQSHHLSKGDVIVIPAGTPHWFKEVPSSVSYFVVKVLK